MELKVTCDCGQKYKFDVEPVNGRMPYAINCPVCGVDGTPLANRLLAEQQTAGAPGISSPTAGMAVPPPVAGASGLRINRPEPASAPAPLPIAAASARPAPLSGIRPATGVRPAAAVKVASGKFSLGLGILGAFIGAALGGLCVYAFFVWLNLKFPLSGTGIGALSGLGARMLARGTDAALGAISAGIAALMVMGVFYLIDLQFGIFYTSAIISAGVGGYLAYRIAS